jgi:hypothetical protein
MSNALQDTINYISPFCRYQKPNIGVNNMPIIGIGNLVRNIILAAPFQWAFNRNFNDSIETSPGVQDYPTNILDFGFLEKATIQDIDGKIYELTDVKNNLPLGKSTTKARPFQISVQTFGTLLPTIDLVIKSTFTFADFMDNSVFNFTIPNEVSEGDTVVFGLELSEGSGIPNSVVDSLGNVITLISAMNAGGSTVPTQLGVAANYALLAAAGITNTGATLITGGNIGSFPTTTITGFTGANFTPPATIDNANASAAQTAALAAYTFYSGLTFVSLSGSSANLSVLGNGSTASTYIPGNYSAGSSMDIPTSITLDAQNNPNALFVFKAGSTLTLESGASILLINGAQAANVVWIVGSSATTVGTIGVFNGNILANTSITIGGGTFNGRALAGIITTSGAITIATAVNLTVPAGTSDRHEFLVYNMPVVIPGTSTITVTTDVSMPRDFLVQGYLLTGVGPIQLTSPVNNHGSSQTWSSQSLTTIQPSELLISFTTSYAPPASVTDNFELFESGTISDSLSPDVQLNTAALMTTKTGVYTSSWKQSASGIWQIVLVGYPVLTGVGAPTPSFRFSAVPGAEYPVNLIYQRLPVQFVTISDSWFPIPDSFSDVYNNLCLGYYMDSCQDGRAKEYIARGIAGLLSRSEGLSSLDKALFAQAYMGFASSEMLNTLRTQQGVQAQGAR